MVAVFPGNIGASVPRKFRNMKIVRFRLQLCVNNSKDIKCVESEYLHISSVSLEFAPHLTVQLELADCLKRQATLTNL